MKPVIFRPQVFAKTVVILTLTVLLLMIALAPARAGGVVGSGTPTSCDNAALMAALVGGGTVTFNCGPNPHTISVTTQVINSGVTTIVDGGGLITLDGGGTLQIFLVLTGGSLHLQDITLTNGNFNSGGGIYNEGTTSLKNVTITKSKGDGGNGGAVFNKGTLSIEHSTLTGNSATFGGGAISNNGGTVTIKDSTLGGNQANYGGAIDHNGGTITVESSTLVGNIATTKGGGIYNLSGQIDLTNVTLGSNIADQGGGIYAEPATTNNLLNVTLNINRADLGGGIYNNNSNTTLQNTIVANSLDTAGLITSLNCDGPSITSAGYNIFGDNTCEPFSLNDQHATDPKLGPLQDNGGPTFTHLPLVGSPAIDEGAPTGCPALDQRGYVRPVGMACDVGAVEFGSSAPTPTPTATPTPTMTPTPTSTPTSTPGSTSLVYLPLVTR